ncbi:MAG: peptide deformylase [Anaerofustis sp.]
MIQPIMKDILFLGQKSVPATKADFSVAQDLLDTLSANADRCVGMAANMIGVLKRIIVYRCEAGNIVMFNPEIVASSEPYETEEGCLSLVGTRKTRRFRTIEVSYRDANFRARRQVFTDFTAQIIQHEIDHCNGVII